MSQHHGKKVINTPLAPKAIGPYSQAIRINDTVFLSGQIGLMPVSGEMVSNDIVGQATQVFKNLSEVAKASDGSLNDVVKLTIYLTDMKDFPHVNSVMAEFFSAPYPARATVAVSELPRNALVEVEALLMLNKQEAY